MGLGSTTSEEEHDSGASATLATGVYAASTCLIHRYAIGIFVGGCSFSRLDSCRHFACCSDWRALQMVLYSPGFAGSIDCCYCCQQWPRWQRLHYPCIGCSRLGYSRIEREMHMFITRMGILSLGEVGASVYIRHSKANE